MAKKDNTYDSIIADIRARKFSPVYILMGEESYFIDKITDLMLNTVVDEDQRDFNQLILYGADTEVTTVLNAVKRFPMMSEYQLVVVREAQLIKEKDLELLVSYLKNPLKSTVLVLNYKYKTLDRRRLLAATAEKIGVVFHSKKLYDNQMPDFIVDVLKQKNMAIDPKACQMLVEYVGNDLNRLIKELDKLVMILSDNGASKVTPDLVEQNIGISKEYNNFELIKALAVKDVLKANRIIRYFEQDPKNNPIQLTLSVLFNYFTNLFICYYSKDKSDYGLMNELGLKSLFLVKDYVAGVRYYSAMKVFRTLHLIRETDARSKGFGGNSVSDADLLKELIYYILH